MKSAPAMPYEANIIYSVIIVFLKNARSARAGWLGLLCKTGKIMNTNQGLPNSNALLSMVCFFVPLASVYLATCQGFYMACGRVLSPFAQTYPTGRGFYNVPCLRRAR